MPTQKRMKATPVKKKVQPRKKVEKIAPLEKKKTLPTGLVAQEAFRRRARLRGNAAAGTHPTSDRTNKQSPIKTDHLKRGVSLNPATRRSQPDPTHSKQQKGKTVSTAPDPAAAINRRFKKNRAMTKKNKK